MGLQNSKQNIKYIRLREGKFYEGADKENGFPELEGRIVGLRYKDEEYEGAPVRKLIVTLDDGVDRFQLGLNTDSQNYSTFVSFLKGVDINDNITLHPKVEAINKDGKDFKKNSLLVSQDGTFAKGYFTKDAKHGAPEWKTVTVGKKKVTDKSDYLAFMEQFVTENYINALNGEAPVAQAAALKTTEKAPVDNDDEQDAVENTTAKLPWEN